MSMGDHVRLEDVSLDHTHDDSGPKDDSKEAPPGYVHERPGFSVQGRQCKVFSAAAVVLVFVLVIVMAALRSRDGDSNGSSGNSSCGSTGVPRNVIFVVPDGMGPAVATMGREFIRKLSGQRTAELVIDKFPVGLTSPRCLQRLFRVGDSATSATGMSTGVSVNKAQVAWDSEGCPLASIPEAVKDQKGMAAGFVVTSTVTHATPAAFSVHGTNRYAEPDFARQLAASSWDVIIGGGSRFFYPQNVSGSHRSDDIDVFAEARANDFEVLKGVSSFRALDPATTVNRKIMAIPNDNGKPSGHMAYEIDRNNATEPSLAETTSKALDIMTRKNKPFFLLVEASRIDHSMHAADISACYHEVKAFDDMMKVVRDYATNRGDTLVVVQPDHDTGSAVLANDPAFNLYPSITHGLSMYVYEALDTFTSSLSVVNNAIIDDLKSKGIAKTNGIYASASAQCDTLRTVLQAHTKTQMSPTSAQCTEIINTHDVYVPRVIDNVGESAADYNAWGNALYRWATAPYASMRLGTYTDFAGSLRSDNNAFLGHSAVDVNLYAFGPGSEHFRGHHEIYHIGYVLQELLGVDLEAQTRKLRTLLCTGQAGAAPGVGVCNTTCVDRTYASAYTYYFDH